MSAFCLIFIFFTPKEKKNEYLFTKGLNYLLPDLIKESDPSLFKESFCWNERLKNVET